MFRRERPQGGGVNYDPVGHRTTHPCRKARRDMVVGRQFEGQNKPKSQVGHKFKPRWPAQFMRL